MEGEQLPKATMNSFIKSHTNMHFSAEFITKMLSLSRTFVTRLAARSNQMCEKHNKKTISAEHLEAALVDYGLNQHIHNLKELGSNIKEMNQQKREANQRLEETIEREMKEERQRRLLEEPEKKVVTVREKFQQIDAVNIDNNEDDFDYEQLAEEGSPKQEQMEL